jgi:Putative Flp pilus-assembly TadE/G-like
MTTFKAQLKSRVASAIHAFRKDTAGAVALTFALSSLPIFAAAGVALDYNRTLDARVMLQDLADRAALAAASNKGTTQQQIDAGYALLNSNATEVYGLDYTPNVSVNGDKVTVTITGELEGTLTKILSSKHEGSGFDGGANGGGGMMGVDTKAVAQFEDSDGEPVCVLATETTIADPVNFWGNASVTANDCGVHSDSNSVTDALNLQGSADLDADFVSVVGGVDAQTKSNLTSAGVPLREGQSTIGDPLQKTVTCPTTAGVDASPTGSSASPTPLNTETYKGIDVKNNKYGTFSAGIHYIKGTIKINGGLLKGTGVTLVLCGPLAKIDMQGNGSLQITAPTTGSTKGYAIIGNSTATATNSMLGGSSSYIRGAWYTPNATLNISGNGGFNQNSSYFPIISKKVEVGGSAAVNIGMDYAVYGFEKPEELWINKGRTVSLVE